MGAPGPGCFDVKIHARHVTLVTSPPTKGALARQIDCRRRTRSRAAAEGPQGVRGGPGRLIPPSPWVRVVASPGGGENPIPIGAGVNLGRPSPQIDPRSSMPHHPPPVRRRLDPSRGGRKDVGRAREAHRGRRVRHDRGSDAVSVRRPHGGPKDRRARNTTTIHHHPHGGGGKWQSRVTLDADADSAAAKSTAASRASRSRSATPGSTATPKGGERPDAEGRPNRPPHQGSCP